MCKASSSFHNRLLFTALLIAMHKWLCVNRCFFLHCGSPALNWFAALIFLAESQSVTSADHSKLLRRQAAPPAISNKTVRWRKKTPLALQLVTPWKLQHRTTVPRWNRLYAWRLENWNVLTKTTFTKWMYKRPIDHICLFKIGNLKMSCLQKNVSLAGKK